jgi:DNA-binding NtrC family response regulator
VSQRARPPLLLLTGPATWEALARALADAGVRVVERPGEEVLEVVSTARADRPPAGSSTSVPWVWLAPGAVPVAAIRAAAAAGAVDVIDGSGPPAAVAARLVARAEEQRSPADPPREAPDAVAVSAASRRLLRELHHAAQTSMPVLLTGETGTGKDVAARLLHAWSSRHKRPFIPINCAAIPNEMLEAELFGYAKGAFSGAVQAYAGQLAGGEHGTVLLDEVDDTPLPFQVKLLRVLEDRVVSRLGENEWRKVDFRIIAATNRDLRELIARGQFGPDLYERLAIVSIRLPPLRERREDIPGLCDVLIARFYGEEPTARARHLVSEVTPEALHLLTAYSWPGNIRELRNVLYGALVRKRSGTQLLVSDLSSRLLKPPAASADRSPSAPSDRASMADAMGAGAFNLRAAIAALEREAVGLALERTQGNASAAAALLGEVGRGTAQDPGATVRAMARRLGIHAPGRAGVRSPRT